MPRSPYGADRRPVLVSPPPSKHLRRSRPIVAASGASARALRRRARAAHRHDAGERLPKDATHFSTLRWPPRSASPRRRFTGAGRARAPAAPPLDVESLPDPPYIETFRDVVRPFLVPPERAVVLCVDQKSQIQSLDRRRRSCRCCRARQSALRTCTRATASPARACLLEPAARRSRATSTRDLLPTLWRCRPSSTLSSRPSYVDARTPAIQYTTCSRPASPAGHRPGSAAAAALRAGDSPTHRPPRPTTRTRGRRGSRARARRRPRAAGAARRHG